jgi:hypothetical protein
LLPILAPSMQYKLIERGHGLSQIESIDMNRWRAVIILNLLNAPGIGLCQNLDECSKQLAEQRVHVADAEIRSRIIGMLRMFYILKLSGPVECRYPSIDIREKDQSRSWLVVGSAGSSYSYTYVHMYKHFTRT